MAPKVKWRKAKQVPKLGDRLHFDNLISAPMGIGTSSFVILPEPEGEVSVAIVDESGKISFWIMRNVSVRVALTFLHENGNPNNRPNVEFFFHGND